MGHSFLAVGICAKEPFARQYSLHNTDINKMTILTIGLLSFIYYFKKLHQSIPATAAMAAARSPRC
jgi:hypothetical protein